MKPCRRCDKLFKPNRNNQFFCSDKCCAKFFSRYRTAENWFIDEWTKWKRDFAARKLSADKESD